MRIILKRLSFVVILIALLVLFIDVIGRDLSEQFLKYVAIIVSWPVAVTLIALLFKKEIADLIGRLTNAEFPGGKIQAAQPGASGPQDDNVSTPSPQSKELIEDIRRDYEERFKNYEENHKTTINLLFDEISKKELELEFERIYNVIFGSQIRLLGLLLPRGELGLPRKFVDSFFREIQKVWPSLSTWSTDSYLEYLINATKIIEVTPTGNYKITPKGEEFLIYISSRNYSKNVL